MKDVLDDFPLPDANQLLFAGAALAGATGLATVVKPQKMHEAYFSATDKDNDDAPTPFHKQSTRWLGMSLGWVGGLCLAAGLAPKGNKVKRNVLVANGCGLLAGAAMDGYNLSKSTQKKKVTAGEIAAIGTLGVLSIARAIKDNDDVVDAE